MNITSSDSVYLNDKAWKAAYNGNIEVLDTLLKDGHDFGQTYAYGRTIAFPAAFNGHESCLLLLKKAGCPTLGRQIIWVNSSIFCCSEWSWGMLAYADGCWL